MRSHLSPELLVGLAGCCTEEAWASLQECEGSEETGAWAEDSGIGDLSEGRLQGSVPAALPEQSAWRWPGSHLWAPLPAPSPPGQALERGL